MVSECVSECVECVHLEFVCGVCLGKRLPQECWYQVIKKPKLIVFKHL